MTPWGCAIFGQQNRYLNKLGKVQLGDAAYQISSLLFLWFQTRFFLFSTSKPIPGNAIFGPRPLFGPLGDIKVSGHVVSDKIFYAPPPPPPTLKKLKGHISLGLSLRPSVCASVTKIIFTVLKQHRFVIKN